MRGEVTPSEFRLAVASFLAARGEAGERAMSEEFDCMRSWPRRCALGTARPHPRIQTLIVRWIDAETGWRPSDG